jgi:hypothetical protein
MILDATYLHSYNALEEVIKMGECVVCRETVTNPVCPRCLRAEVGAWLNETRPELLKDFEKISAEISTVVFGNEHCILCKRGMDVCTYCYTEHIFNWLLTTSPTREFMNEFLLLFNFDAGRRGYLQRAEKLGYETQ